MEGEVWRPIPGFDPYEASSEGRIRSRRPRYRRGRGLVLKPWVETRHGRDAARVALYLDGRKVNQFVHRLVALAFHGEPPPECADCCHVNHDALDNRAANLRWDTHSNNIRENYDRERRAIAEEELAAELAQLEAPQENQGVPF